MQFDIRSNAADVSRWLSDAEKAQVPFATVYAMTLTARDVREVEIGTMQRVFDRPTPYALYALRVQPATRASMVASVEYKEFGGTPAKRFLNPEVHGGERSQKASERLLLPLMRGYRYWVPGRGAELNGYGNVSGAVVRRILSQVKASSDPLSNASNSARSKRKRKNDAFFVPKTGSKLRAGVWQRKGGGIKPVLIFVNRASYRKRFPFYETAGGVVADRFKVNFERALQSAMATSSYKGKWR
jgi:hypothetical protein